MLAEIGDDRSRFTNAKGLKAFAGAAPITRASGRSVTVLARRVKNQRLASAGSGCLPHCLAHGTHYDETTAFPAPTSPGPEAAA